MYKFSTNKKKKIVYEKKNYNDIKLRVNLITHRRCHSGEMEDDRIVWPFLCDIKVEFPNPVLQVSLYGLMELQNKKEKLNTLEKTKEIK